MYKLYIKNIVIVIKKESKSKNIYIFKKNNTAYIYFICTHDATTILRKIIKQNDNNDIY